MKNEGFKIKGYIKANDGKLYKYNTFTMNEHGYVYFGPDNIVICKGEVKREFMDKEKYLVFDHFILDLVHKTINEYFYSESLKDSFAECNKNIKKIDIQENEQYKEIFLLFENGSKAYIQLNKVNQIICYKNNYVETIGDNFLWDNNSAKNIELFNVKKIGNNFLSENNSVKDLKLPNVQIIGDRFLGNNKSITDLKLPNVKFIGDFFLYLNEVLKYIELPKVEKIGESFLSCNKSLLNVNLPSVEAIGDYFMRGSSITNIEIPNVKIIGNYFLDRNKSIKYIKLPSVEIVGDCFMQYCGIRSIKLPSVETVGNKFLMGTRVLNDIEIPNIKSMGVGCLSGCSSILRDMVKQQIEENNHRKRR